MLSFLRRIAELAAQGAVASAEEVLEELTKIARANIRGFAGALARCPREHGCASAHTYFPPNAGAGLSLRRNIEPNISMACRRALLMNYFVSYPADKQGVISV
jgi:hypothetical protein